MSHTTSLKVRFSDLDPYDHLNHARCLTFFETARIEALEAMGFGIGQMKQGGIQIVLVELVVRFHTSPSMHDELTVTTEVVEVRRTTTAWRQEMRNSDEPVASLEITAAFTDSEGRPRRAPEGFAAAALAL